MCTAVDGGSIQRAAKRVSAASDQTSTAPTASHRIKDRIRRLRSCVLEGVSGFSITFQNNSLSWVAAHGGSTRSAAFCSGHSPKALVLNHMNRATRAEFD